MEDKKYTNIDEYVSSFPTDIQKILQNLRQVIHAAAPEAQEVISYSMHAFKLNGILVLGKGFMISLKICSVHLEYFSGLLQKCLLFCLG